jgi:surface protein
MKQPKLLFGCLKHRLLICSIALLAVFTTQSQNEFTTVWTVGDAAYGDGDLSITIPTLSTAGTYNYSVDWGDSMTETGQTSSATHTYSTAGNYEVKISGDFPSIYFNNTGDKTKIIELKQWGNIQWLTMKSAFRGCTNLQVTATDVPDLSNVTSLQQMFYFASVADPDVSSWNTANVTDMGSMFQNATSANPNVSMWNTANVTNMSSMFQSASSAIPNVSMWNTTEATNMYSMFRGATLANPDVTMWETSKLTRADFMFSDATVANPDLSEWDIGSVTNLSRLFNNSGISQANYEAALENFAGQTVRSNVTMGARGATYCTPAAQTARASLIADNTWTIIDDALCVGNFILSTTTLTIGENAGTSTFTVVLGIMPDSDVVFDLTSGDVNEATVTPTSLTFASGDWNTPQTVTVTGVDDTVTTAIDDIVDITISVNDTSSYIIYDATPDQVVTITLTDDDATAGLNDVSFNASAFNIYPNPLSGSRLNYSYPKAIEDLTVEVYTFLGQKIQSVKATTNGSGKNSLDLNLASGIYIIKFGNSKSQNNIIKRLIIN